MPPRLTGPRLAALGFAAAVGLVATPALAAVIAEPPPAPAAAAPVPAQATTTSIFERTTAAREGWTPRSVPTTVTPRPRLVPAPPAPVPTPTPRPKGLQPRPDGLNWAALARCESGGDPTIVSRTGKYHGLYQFDRSTWQSVGGTGVASTAPAAEQTARAQMLHARRGAAPWPECGRRL